MVMAAGRCDAQSGGHINGIRRRRQYITGTSDDGVVVLQLVLDGGPRRACASSFLQLHTRRDKLNNDHDNDDDYDSIPLFCKHDRVAGNHVSLFWAENISTLRHRA
jgi:hypothetical protein